MTQDNQFDLDTFELLLYRVKAKFTRSDDITDFCNAMISEIRKISIERNAINSR